MWLRFRCPNCKQFGPAVFTEQSKSMSGEVFCKSKHSIPYKLSASLLQDNRWDACPVCESPDAFIQKAVPQNFMLMATIVGMLVAFYFLGKNWVVGMAILVWMATVDWVLFKTLANVLVCYRCKSEARGYKPSERFRVFDHHIAEKWRN